MRQILVQPGSRTQTIWVRLPGATNCKGRETAVYLVYTTECVEVWTTLHMAEERASNIRFVDFVHSRALR